MSQIRLDKYLSESGLGTRSQVKEYLKKGRVSVNGAVVKKPEQKIQTSDEVRFDGHAVSLPGINYYMFHKPAGCITAARDKNAATVMDYFADAPENDLAPVGRLDKDTEGFLLITNDGALNHFLLSPKRHVDKTYFARVSGALSADAPERFRAGLDIGDEKPTLPAQLELVGQSGELTEVRITLHEGRFHQVKRMVEAVGGEVVYLKRISFGGIPLDETLEKGEYRELTEAEIAALKASADTNGGTRE